MAPGEFAHRQIHIAEGDQRRIALGNCDFAFRAKSPGGIICRPYGSVFFK